MSRARKLVPTPKAAWLVRLLAVPALAACGGGSPAPTAAPSTESAPAARTPTEEKHAATGSASTAPKPESAPNPAKPPVATEPTPLALGRAHVLFGSHTPWGPLTSEAASDAASTPPQELGTTWKLLRTIAVGYGYLSHAELSEDGSEAFVLSDAEGALRRYEVKTGKLLERYPFPEFKEFDSVAFTLMPGATTAGQALVSGPRAAGVLDLQSGKFSFVYPHSTELRPSGRPGLLGLSVQRIEPQSGSLDLVWFDDPKSAELAARIVFEERPDNWALSRDGKTLLTLYYPSNQIEVVDLEAGVVKFRVTAPQYARGLALSPDGKLVAVGGAELRLYDAATGQLLGTDTSFKNNIHEARFTPDGRLLLVSAYDGRARSFQIRAGELGPKQLLQHSGTANVYALGLDKLGSRLVTASGDKTIKLWQR